MFLLRGSIRGTNVTCLLRWRSCSNICHKASYWLHVLTKLLGASRPANVAAAGQRGDQARHLLVGVQEDHQQGRCVRVPGAGAVNVEHFDMPLLTPSQRVALVPHF